MNKLVLLISENLGFSSHDIQKYSAKCLLLVNISVDQILQDLPESYSAMYLQSLLAYEYFAATQLNSPDFLVSTFSLVLRCCD